MASTQRTLHPTPHSTTEGYKALLLAFASIVIYFLQLLGKISTTAAIAAGVLVIAKALLEAGIALHRLHHKTHRPLPQKLVTLLPIQPPVAGCYCCHHQRPLRDYAFQGGRVGVCSDCYRSITGMRAPL